MYLFKFKSDSNSYIAKTEKEKNRILKKYKNNYTVQKGLFADIYIINDRGRK